MQESDVITIDSDSDEVSDDGIPLTDSDDELTTIFSTCPCCGLSGFRSMITHVPNCQGIKDAKTQVEPKKEWVLKQNVPRSYPQVKQETDAKKMTKQEEIHNTCCFCRKQVSPKQMTAHKVYYCKEKRNKCHKCQKRFRSNQALGRHISVGCQVLRFECKTCLRRFVTGYKLDRHRVLNKCATDNILAIEYPQLKEEPKVCSLCGEESTNAADYEIHLRLFCKGTSSALPMYDGDLSPTPGEEVDKNPEDRYTCPCCYLRCGNQEEFQIHSTQFCPMLPYPCTNCAQRFISLSMLKCHEEECL